MGAEDGTYSIQADFEEQGGFYDDYGNFFGSGSSSLGNTSKLLDVPPLIALVSVVFQPPTLQPVQASVSNAVATIIYTDDVPANTTVDIELSDAITGGNPLYVLNPPTFSPSSGGTATGTRNRTATLTVPEGGGSPRTVRVTFPFQLSQNTGAGTVYALVRIGNVVVSSPAPSPTVAITPPSTNGLNATLTIATPTPAPTPSPTPTPSGPPPGGCSGAVSFVLYPGTGCATGFVNNGGFCTRSSQFQRRCAEPAGYDPDSCSCPDGTNNSPIIIDVDGSGFPLTNAANGVDFDILALSYPQRISWTKAASTNAFLVLDRDKNGRIDNGEELFGNITPQPESIDANGFIALAEYDKAGQGGNGDGKITRKDAIFRKLRLWTDRNHNGISEPEELSRLPALDVVAIRLDYQESDRVDQYGNRFRYRARVRDKANANAGRWAWDVFFKMQP
jgi:hypothetical protein